MIKWSCKAVKVSELKEYADNPRHLMEKGMEDLKASISKFGMSEPLCCNPDMTIIGGHARKKTLEALNIEEVNVFMPDRVLTEKEVKELNIRLNKNVAGEFDFEVLANTCEIDELVDWGFSEEELVGLKDPIEETGTEDDIPPVPVEPRSKLGDLYELGNHRVLCGDSTDKEIVAVLMDGQKANMVFTDPPYGMNAVSNSGVLSKRYSSDIKNDDSPDTAKKAFALCESLQIEKIVFWGANYYADCLTDSSCWLVWDKNNGNSDQMDCELAWTNLKGCTRRFVQASEKINRVHPTQKPVDLPVWCFKKYEAGDVLDLFLGSGSTLIACELTNRKCYGIELDPIYMDVIVQRYVDYVGDNKIKLNGESIEW